jgi:hypothetical protein
VSDSAAADIPPGETATPPVPPFEPVRVVPTRPDGWPGWLGRGPVSPADRDKILKGLQAGQDELTTAERRDSLQLAPLFSCLTIEGLAGQDGPRTVPRLPASINVACRVAAGDRRTSYRATDERITIGIAGPDVRERIAGLRRQLARLLRFRLTVPIPAPGSNVPARPRRPFQPDPDSDSAADRTPPGKALSVNMSRGRRLVRRGTAVGRAQFLG